MGIRRRILLSQKELNLLLDYTVWFQELSVDDITVPPTQLVEAYKKRLFYGD